MATGIIVFGLNGSGKTTLGGKLAEALGYKHMDIEDYYFEKSDIPFTKERPRQDFIKMMQEDINTYQNFVLSSVKGDFDVEIVSAYTLGVFISVPKDIRLKRVQDRSTQKFGSRIDQGGDLYESEKKFFEFVKTRNDDGIREWAKTLTCPIIQIDGRKDIAENIDYIKNELVKYKDNN